MPRKANNDFFNLFHGYPGGRNGNAVAFAEYRNNVIQRRDANRAVDREPDDPSGDDSDLSLSRICREADAPVFSRLTRFTAVCTDGRETDGGRRKKKVHQVGQRPDSRCLRRWERLYAEIRICFLVPDVHSRVPFSVSEVSDRNKKRTGRLVQLSSLQCCRKRRNHHLSAREDEGNSSIKIMDPRCFKSH